jgi:hypothetical protein
MKKTTIFIKKIKTSFSFSFLPSSPSVGPQIGGH